MIATVVHLLDTTNIRVGNDEYARDNKSFGLTTMRERHVEVDGSHLTLSVSRQEREAARRRARPIHAPRAS